MRPTVTATSPYSLSKTPLGLQKEKCREQIPQKRQRDETFPRHNAPDMAPHFESHHSVDSSHSSCLLSKDSYQTRGDVRTPGFINTIWKLAAKKCWGSIDSEHLSRFCIISITCSTNNTQITCNVTRDMQHNTVDVITGEFQLDWKDFGFQLLEQQHLLKFKTVAGIHLVTHFWLIKLLFLSLWYSCVFKFGIGSKCKWY